MTESLPKGVMPVFVSDAARRASDIINGHRLTQPWEDLKTKWCAIRLSDGGSDGTLYDSKAEAVRFQFHETQCWYVCFSGLMGGSNAGECQRLLEFYRKAYAAGFKMVDPDELLPTASTMDSYKRQQDAANAARIQRAMNNMSRKDKRAAMAELREMMK